jgi:RNA polymerase sigma factor (sigma-70 family)
LRGLIRKYSQNAIIEGILHKDEEVVSYLYDEYFRLIKQFILNNAGDTADSQDIFQETLIILFQKVRTGNFQVISSLKTYLYSVARIIWLKELRRRKTLTTSDTYTDSAADQEIIETIERKERLDFYRAKYDELSDDCKQLLRMFLNNIPIKEITIYMGYKSEQHTKNRHLRCKNSLIKRIQSSSKFKELGNG